MFCHKCGISLAEDASFCHNCGTKVPDRDVVADISVEAARHAKAGSDEPTMSAPIELHINLQMGVKGIFHFMVSKNKYAVLVDGIEIGQLSDGESLVYNVTPGKHNVAIGYYRIWLDIPAENVPITLITHLDEDGKPQMLCDQSHLVAEAPPGNPSLDAEKFDMRSMWKDFVACFKEMSINKKILVVLGGIFVAIVFGFIFYMILSLILSLPIVLVIVAAGGIIFYRKYGRGLIAKYDEHFSKTGNNRLFQLLAIGGGIIYCILFFFPWVKVAGQDWLAFFGYGSTDGFNPIGLLRLVATFIKRIFDIFGNHIEIDAIDPMIFIAIIIFIGVLIAPITSLWGNIKNLFNIIFKPDESKLDTTSEGPLGFIVVYHLAHGVIQSYISDATSLDWLGYAAGNLYGNLIELSAIPWILLLLSFINWYCAKRYICSRPVDLTCHKSPETPDRVFDDAKTGSPFRMTVQDVFIIRGCGTVVTGQIESGRITVGDKVNIIGKGSNIRSDVVAGIAVSRKKLDCAQAGHDVGLLFKSIGKDDIEHGNRLEKIL